MQRLRTIHLFLGLVGLAAFVLSGQYMHHFLGHLKGMPDGPRLMYRSAHIYFLWACLLNLSLGSHLAIASRRRSRQFQVLASALLMLAPFLIGLSFLTESGNPDLFRPLARYGIFSAVAGCMIHVFVAFSARRQREHI